MEKIGFNCSLYAVGELTEYILVIPVNVFALLMHYINVKPVCFVMNCMKLE